MLLMCVNITELKGTKMNIGKKIRMKRVELGMKQNELARLSGVSRVTLSNIERNNANMSTDILLRIAKSLGINLAYFDE